MENRVDITSARWPVVPSTKDEATSDPTPWIRTDTEGFPLTVNEAVYQVGLVAKELVKEAGKAPADRFNRFGDQVRTAVFNTRRTLDISKLVSDESLKPSQQLKRWRYVLYGWQNLSKDACEVNSSLQTQFADNVKHLNKYFELLHQMSSEATEDDLSDRRIFAKRVDGRLELTVRAVANKQAQGTHEAQAAPLQTENSPVEQQPPTGGDIRSVETNQDPEAPSTGTPEPRALKRAAPVDRRLLAAAASVAFLVAMLLVMDSMWSKDSGEF